MIFIRKFIQIFSTIAVYMRVIKLQLIYPNIKINLKSTIGKNCNIRCDKNSYIEMKNVDVADNVILHAKRGGTIKLNNCFIGFSSVIVAINSITIDKDTEIAEMVVIRDQNHIHNLSDEPIKNQGYKTDPIIINENVWIGAKATILKGVTIGKNSIVGANAVVTKNISSHSIAVGIPAKIIKK